MADVPAPGRLVHHRLGLAAEAAILPAMAQTVNREVQDIPGTVAQTQQAIYEAERLIKGIQQNWLIRKHVPQEQPTALIPTFDIPRVPRSSGPAGDVPQEGAP